MNVAPDQIAAVDRTSSRDPVAPTVFVMEASGKAALPVIESMARAGFRVAAGSERRLNSGFFSRSCRERHVYPSTRFQKAAFQEWLLKFLRSRPIDMLFQLGHYGALAVNEIQDEVRRHTRIIMPSASSFLAAYEKIPTMKTALAAGVPIPDSWFPAEHSGGIEGVLSLIERWPVLIKPSVGVGARGITWCYSADEVRANYDRLTAEHGPCYLQDFVPPGGMQYKVDMLMDAHRNVLAAIAYGKTRMYPPDGGSSVLNFSADRPDVIEYSRKMLVALNWLGFCDFDYVVDPRDGVAKLMEINPRFPESFNMGISVGIDFPLMMHRMAHGEPVEAMSDYPKNRFLRFLPGDIMWFLRVSNKQRFSTWPSWFQFRKDTSYQLLRARDPGPIIGYLLENLAALLNPALLRDRLRLSSGTKKKPADPVAKSPAP